MYKVKINIKISYSNDGYTVETFSFDKAHEAEDKLIEQIKEAKKRPKDSVIIYLNDLVQYKQNA